MLTDLTQLVLKGDEWHTFKRFQYHLASLQLFNTPVH